MCVFVVPEADGVSWFHVCVLLVANYSKIILLEEIGLRSEGGGGPSLMNLKAKDMQSADEFFTAFARFNASENELPYETFFASTFMVAGADGARILTPEQLGAVALKRKALFDQLGRRSVELVGMEERTLDPYYVLTTTEWRWHFEPEGSAGFDITLPATHILHRSPAGLRIVFYRTGEVIQALRERGLAV